MTAKPENRADRAIKPGDCVPGSPNPITANTPLRPYLLAAITALSISRPLVPSEGAAWLGDGQPWVMLWLIVAALTLLSAVARGRLAVPLKGIDIAVGALIVWHTIAATAAVRIGSPRPAVNMLWEWIGMGAGFFCLRQLVRSRQEARALLAAMIALAVGLSVLGYHQYFVAQPAERAEFARDPERTLAQAGEWYPPDSPQRKQFEERLESREPLATFALANSLAGFLVPWLIVALAVAANAAGWRCGVLSAVIAGSLVLTKCRSGYVATGVGIAALYVLSPRGRRWLSGRRLLIAAGAILLLVGGAILVRGLDSEVITEAGKSLTYRMQYWRATWSMICDHPWLGCGPGNFQDDYTVYKLPEASEEVRDPHNFLLEIWATAGTPAVLAMMAVLACLGFRTLRACRTTVEDLDSPHPLDSPAADSAGATLWFIAGGGLAGLLLAYGFAPLVGLSFELDRLLLVGIAGIATWMILAAWIRCGPLRPEWLAAAVAAQCVHHLAAGGIGYPGVAGSFWLLSALLANETEADETQHAPPVQTSPWQRIQPLLGLVATLVAVGCCYLTGYGPVLRCQAAMDRAFESAGSASPDTAPQDGQQQLRAAAAADPLSAEPVRLLAEYELGRWKQDRTPQSLRRFSAAADAMLHLRPNASAVWQRMGQWYLEIYALTQDRSDAEKAAGYFERAVERYPTSATLNADLAEACSAAGQADEARQTAAAACRLDASTPHVDKQLTASQRKRMQDIAHGSR